MAEKASVFRRSGRNVEAHYWAEEITGTARGRTKQGRKQRYKIKVDIKISRCSAGGSAPALGAGCRRFESCHLDHNRTPILIQCVSWLVSVFFIRKSLFNGIYRYNLTKEGSAMTEKRSHQSLFYFLPLYYLTKSCKGVHFRQGGVHFLIIPKNNKKPQKADLWPVISKPLYRPGCNLLENMI